VYVRIAEHPLASWKLATTVPTGKPVEVYVLGPGDPAIPSHVTPLYGVVPPEIVIVAVPVPPHGAAVLDVVALSADG